MAGENIKIIVACHKKCSVPSDAVYFPVHVGSEGKTPIGFTPDNTGDNISTKNCMFSEMTGLYWAWKNLECDYIGLVHYSRYLAMRGKLGTVSLDEVLTGEEAKKLLQKYKIILPCRRKYYIETLYSHYSHTADAHHLDVTREIISRKCPEYLDSFDTVMRRTWGHMLNMFMTSREIADKYCGWVFSILPDLEYLIDTSKMTQYERRFIGAVSEMMLDVWIDHQIKQGTLKQEDIIEIPYVYTRKINWPKKIASFLMAKFFHRKYTRSF